VKPIDICTRLGRARIDSYYDLLNAKEVRSVLKAGGSHADVPATAFTKAGRLAAWRRRFDAEFERGNNQLALALLIEWLMRHRRQMLVDYLDFLQVPHRMGETDEDFCETRPPERLREGADVLLGKYPPHEVASYLLLIGHLQETPVFDRTPKLLEALGFETAEAAAYVAEHERTWRKPVRDGAA
jgi:hypothetical protein